MVQGMFSADYAKHYDLNST